MFIFRELFYLTSGLVVSFLLELLQWHFFWKVSPFFSSVLRKLGNSTSDLSSLDTMLMKNNQLLNLFFPYLLKDVLYTLLCSFLDDKIQYVVKLLQFLLGISYY